MCEWRSVSFYSIFSIEQRLERALYSVCSWSFSLGCPDARLSTPLVEEQTNRRARSRRHRLPFAGQFREPWNPIPYGSFDGIGGGVR
jgi:hypothetical protein